MSTKFATRWLTESREPGIAHSVAKTGACSLANETMPGVEPGVTMGCSPELGEGGEQRARVALIDRPWDVTGVDHLLARAVLRFWFPRGLRRMGDAHVVIVVPGWRAAFLGAKRLPEEPPCGGRGRGLVLVTRNPIGFCFSCQIRADLRKNQ